MKIVKPDAIPCEYVTKFHAEPCYLVRDTVDVDFNKAYDDYNDYLADWFTEESDNSHKENETFLSFREFLQERMK